MRKFLLGGKSVTIWAPPPREEGAGTTALVSAPEFQANHTMRKERCPHLFRKKGNPMAVQSYSGFRAVPMKVGGHQILRRRKGEGVDQMKFLGIVVFGKKIGTHDALQATIENYFAKSQITEDAS